MPKATIDDAQKAMEKVLRRWGAYIPDKVKRFQAKDIFRFHADPFTFESAFELTFATTFRKANGLTCTAKDVGDGVGGFVTPTLSHEARLIHIHPKNLESEFDPMGLLAHEYIHFLSHPNFYPRYYKRGGPAPFHVEGLTEWLMLNACNRIEDGVNLRDLEHRHPEWFDASRWRIVGLGVGKKIGYVAEYEKTQAWLCADRRNFNRMLRFVFEGVETDLSDLHS